MAAAIDAKRTIFALAVACRELFPKCCEGDQSPDADIFPKTKEQYERFHLWASHMGVFATYEASLDKRLESSNQMQSLIVQMLGLVKMNLEFVISKRPGVFSSHSNSTGDSRTLQGNPVEALSAVEAAITRLMNLAFIVKRRPSTRLDSRLKAFIEKHGDDGYINIAQQTVHFRFQAAVPPLKSQLAMSMVTRRQKLLYKRQHQEKLAALSPEVNAQQESRLRSGLSGSFALQTIEEGAGAGGSAHIPESGRKTRSFEPKSLFRASAVNTAPSSTTPSTYRTTESLAAKIRRGGWASGALSSRNSGTAILEGVTDYPEPPKKTGNLEASCPLCSLLLPDSELRGHKWRKHVEKDLQPFVCISEECGQKLQAFESRDLWAKHMREKHSVKWPQLIHKPFSWRCDVDHPQQVFVCEDEDEFKRHLSDHHGDCTSATRKAISMTSKVPRRRAPNICPLCGFDVSVPVSSSSGLIHDPQSARNLEEHDRLNNLAIHIAGHLQRLAVDIANNLITTQGDEFSSSSMATSNVGTDDGSERRALTDKGDLSDRSLPIFDRPTDARQFDVEWHDVDTDSFYLPLPDMSPMQFSDWEDVKAVLKEHTDPKDDPIIQAFKKNSVPANSGDGDPQMTREAEHAVGDTLLLPSGDLWSQALHKTSQETQKWIKHHGLQSSVTQPEDQIKELIRLVEGTKVSEQSEEPFKLAIGNQKLIVREYVADAVAFITMVGDAAIAFAPPQAGAPWAVAKAIMKIPVRQIEQKAALLGTVQWFTRIVRRGQIYEAIYTTETTDEKATLSLHDALLELYIAALELLAKSDTLFESGVARQTLTAILRPDSASGGVKNLAEKEQRLDREAQSCEALRSCKASKRTIDGINDLRKQLDQLSSPLPRIDKGIARLLSYVEKRELDDLMSFISSEMFGAPHARVAETRLDGTGEWLLASKEFRDWQAFPSSSAALCLQGTVGTGKTYLTSKVIDHVKETLNLSDHVKETLKISQNDEGFAYFYCKRSGSSMQDPMDVLKSFVRQLAGRAFGKPGLIRSSLIQRCEDAKRDGPGLAYHDCKDLILDAFDMYSKTTIVLDALDESDISTHNLGAILVELMEKAKKPVKVFISSRPDREYLEELFGDGRIITVDASNQQEDIERYLKEKLYSTSFFQQQSLEIQAMIKDVFATKSRGMFRWVNLQVNSLQTCITDDAIHAWSRKLPRNLTEAYDQLWERIQEHDASDVSLAKRAITWVLCAIRPLAVKTLLEAIRYDVQGPDVVRKGKRTQQQILALCQDLLTIDVRSGIWRLPHASVAEYLEGKGWARWECNLFAAKVSIGFILNFNAEEDEGGFAKYARSDWIGHIRPYEEWLEGNQEVADADLVSLLERFLRSRDELDSRRSYPFYDCSVDLQWQPDHVVLFLLCEMGLWYTMRHWWLGGKFTREMALMQNPRGDNALDLAIKGGYMKICRHLIGLFFAPEHLQTERHTYIRALSTAVKANKIDIVKLLMQEVDLHVDINSPEEGLHVGTMFPEEGGASLAQIAAIFAPDILKWFIMQGWVDLERENASDFPYGNILIAAAAKGHIDSSQLLLKAGANVNAIVHCGKYGNALTAAANRSKPDRTEFIRLLLDHGAVPNMAFRGNHYGSVLEAVVAEEPGEDQRALLHALLEAGMDPLAELEQSEYGTALAAAAFMGNKEMLNVMIARVGREQAIDAFRRSRHPARREFDRVSDIQNWQSTVEYLVEEVGMSREELDAIGLRSLSDNWRDSFYEDGSGHLTLDLG